ncbi:MAG: hypothetical protein ACMZ7B_03975 [Balneola sp.]
MTQEFTLNKIRDFGDIITDTFTYIRVHWRSLGKVFGLYVLSPLIIGIILLGGSIAFSFDNLENPSDTGAFLGAGISIFVGIMFIFFALFMLMGVVYQHIQHTCSGEVPHTFSEFSRGMFGKTFSILMVSFLIGIVVAVALFIFFAIISSFASVLATIIATIILYGLIGFFVIKISLFPVVFFVEGGSASSAIARSWELTENYWWFTFGIYFVINIIFSFLSMFAAIPLIILGGVIAFIFGADFQQDLPLIFGTLYASIYFFQIIASSAQFISLGIHYFNLVERKEGDNLTSEINRLSI